MRPLDGISTAKRDSFESSTSFATCQFPGRLDTGQEMPDANPWSTARLLRYAAEIAHCEGERVHSEDDSDADSNARIPDVVLASSRPGKYFPQDGNFAQPWQPDGVGKGMGTIVLDQPLLHTAPTERLMGSHGHPTPADWSTLSDAEIMLRVSAGEDAGFTYLLDKYRKPIMNFMFRMVRNQAVAEELAQEVFLRVYRSRESYRAEAKFTTWLYRIATNLGVNYARDTRHERAAQNVYLDQPDSRPTIEFELVKDERLKAIRQHVMALPERQRAAVLMHKYQGMDYKQIGEVLKLSESATKSLLFRAYQTLRERLKDFVAKDN
jgi:RNA polymerase sigma-70 factor (ECF subfamily)